MPGKLIITQPKSRECLYRLVDEDNGEIFGAFVCEGLFGRTCHASLGTQRWTFETRRPEIFHKEVGIAPPGYSTPVMSFKLRSTNNCTVRLASGTVYHLRHADRYSPKRVWEDATSSEILAYYHILSHQALTGSVVVPQKSATNPTCALLVMLGLYLIEQNQHGLRLVPSPL
jgi:hypothetical protein